MRKIRTSEAWLAYFSGRYTKKELEEIAMTTPAIKEAVEFEDTFLQNKIERRAYEQREKAIRDYNSTILYNRQERLKEGLKKGAEDKAIEIALKMLENGSDINFIADVTGLSIEKINEIKK